MTSIPSPHQRCPGNARGAPVHSSSRADQPHLWLVSLPALKERAHGGKLRSLSMRQKTSSLSLSLYPVPDSSVWPISTATSIARIHPNLDTTESTATSQNGITIHAFTYGLIKSTLRGLDLSSPCRVFLPPRYNIHTYTYIHIYTYAYIYIYIHTYIYIYSAQRKWVHPLWKVTF